MTVPSFYEFCLPILRALAAGEGPVTKSTLLVEVPAAMGLTDDDLAETIPSGESTVANRLGWALSHMKKPGWVDNQRRGQWTLTEQGAARVRAGHSGQLRELRWQEDADIGTESAAPDPIPQTPTERIASAQAEIHADVASTLLERLKTVPPARFEAIVLQVLVAMGYAGSRGHSEHVGKTNDGGIDGVLYLDRLGLERIYVQAKRWQAPVGAPTVREFAGTMDGEGATKGVILSTSSFTPEARKFLSKSTKTIRLVDGLELARLMVEFDVGVTTVRVIKVTRVDEDFFEPT
jgi:restriction system protein